MSTEKPAADLDQTFDEISLTGPLAAGPLKRGIFAQFQGRINRRNMPAPITMIIAPTGKAGLQLGKTDRSSEHVEGRASGEELEPGILKPKFR